MMVWGMKLPDEFGRYWISGEFEGQTPDRDSGWRERLRLLFNDQPPEVREAWFDYGDKRPGWAAAKYPSFVINKLISERGSRPGPVDTPNPPFSPILPHEWPQFFQVSQTMPMFKEGELASLMMMRDRLLAVDERLKEIIERFESGVHEFAPLELRRGDAVLPFRFYTMFINQYRDSFSPEDSDPDVFKDNGVLGYLMEWALEGGMSIDRIMGGLAFRKDAFGTAHLWKERRLGGDEPICLSEELHSAIVEAGLDVFPPYRMREI